MENNDNNLSRYNGESSDIQELWREIQAALREARLNCDIIELILERYMRNSITPPPRNMNEFMDESYETASTVDVEAVGGFQEMQIVENGRMDEFNSLLPRPRNMSGFMDESYETAGGFQEMPIAENNGGGEDFNYLLPPPYERYDPEQRRLFNYENGNNARRRGFCFQGHIYYSGFLLAVLIFGIVFWILFFKKGAEKKFM